MRGEVATHRLVEIRAEPEHTVLREEAIGPDKITDPFLLNFPDGLLGHFSGNQRAWCKLKNSSRAMRPREEIQTGILRNGENRFAFGVLLFHESNARAILFRQTLFDDDR